MAEKWKKAGYASPNTHHRRLSCHDLTAGVKRWRSAQRSVHPLFSLSPPFLTVSVHLSFLFYLGLILSDFHLNSVFSLSLHSSSSGWLPSRAGAGDDDSASPKWLQSIVIRSYCCFLRGAHQNVFFGVCLSEMGGASSYPIPYHEKPVAVNLVILWTHLSPLSYCCSPPPTQTIRHQINMLIPIIHEKRRRSNQVSSLLLQSCLVYHMNEGNSTGC